MQFALHDDSSIKEGNFLPDLCRKFHPAFSMTGLMNFVQISLSESFFDRNFYVDVENDGKGIYKTVRTTEDFEEMENLKFVFYKDSGGYFVPYNHA